MIILANTTDKLQVVLYGAVTIYHLPCFASYRNRTNTTFDAARTVINTNNTTAVDLVGSPAGSTQRIVDYLSVFNRDTTNATVSILLNANGTSYILFQATLSPGESIMYQEGAGFRVIANSGAVKQSINQGNSPMSNYMMAIILGADVVNNNATANTMQDVSNLQFHVQALSTYYFRFRILYTAAVSTTGSRWSINGPAFSQLSYMSEYTLTTTTSTRNATVQAYNSPSTSNASSVVAQNLAIIEGMITTGGSEGNVVARFASEISNSAITAKAGSVCHYQQLL